jgi:hypothetical protein
MLLLEILLLIAIVSAAFGELSGVAFSLAAIITCLWLMQ